MDPARDVHGRVIGQPDPYWRDGYFRGVWPDLRRDPELARALGIVGREQAVMKSLGLNGTAVAEDPEVEEVAAGEEDVAEALTWGQILDELIGLRRWCTPETWKDLTRLAGAVVDGEGDEA